jgi:diguanylate cyclase (GGDEF)-like protein
MAGNLRKRDRVRLNLTAALGSRSQATRAVITAGLFCGVTLCRFLSGAEYGFAALYLIPISFAGWFLSGAMGVLVALASTLALLTFDFVHWREYSSAAIPYWNGLTDLGLFLFLVFILSEVKGLYDRERQLSREDFLTGVRNRRAFFELLDAESRRARRYARPLTLVYLDVDGFKEVNDRNGHQGGDSLLISLAQAMVSSVRDVDIVARLGGDEFALLLPETDSDAAKSVVEKIRNQLAQAVRNANSNVTFSVGAVTFTEGIDSSDQMLHVADEAMYSVKQGGKNGVAYRTIGPKPAPLPTTPETARQA